MVRHLMCAAVLAACAAWATGADGATTVLGVEGSQFTIDNRPVFLLGISYYAGLAAGAEQLGRDLDELKAKGFNWVRVWATWAAFAHDVSVVDADGRPRAQYMERLGALVAAADERGMIVDVTLSRGNGVTGPPRLATHEAHLRAALAVAETLAGRRNWYLDLSNERNIKDKRFTSFAELKALREAVGKRLPHLLITASHAGDLSADDVKEYVRTVGISFLSPHRPRGKGSPAQTAATTKKLLDWTRQAGRLMPVHYQEPFRRDFGSYQPTARDFLTDLEQARRGGAAGWCLHNGDCRKAKDGQPRRSFDLRGSQRLLERLDDVEREVVEGVTKK